MSNLAYDSMGLLQTVEDGVQKNQFQRTLDFLNALAGIVDKTALSEMVCDMFFRSMTPEQRAKYLELVLDGLKVGINFKIEAVLVVKPEIEHPLKNN